MKNYETQLKEFREHLLNELLNSDAEIATEDERENFYNADFTISFMGKSVTLYNCAETFSAIDDILVGELELMGGGSHD